MAAPGDYIVRMIIGDTLVASRGFKIVKDPRLRKVTDADLQAREAFEVRVSRELTRVHQTVNNIRKINKQLNDYISKVSDTAQAHALQKMAKNITDSLTAIENALVQTKAHAGQDLLRYPVQLNNKLAGLISTANSRDAAPMQSLLDTYADIDARVQVQLNKFERVKNGLLNQFNTTASGISVKAVDIK
jgi:hypothetical protein